MAYERSQYSELEARNRAARKTDEGARQLRMLDRAALESKAVTNDPHWDYYLSTLQAAIEQTETQVSRLHEQLGSDETVSHDAIMTLKLSLTRCEGRLEAWRTALAVPKELIEQGDEVKDLLARLDEDAA